MSNFNANNIFKSYLKKLLSIDYTFILSLLTISHKWNRKICV